MLWHKKAIFELKLRRQVVFSCWMQDSNQGIWGRICRRLNGHWQTDWAIEDQAKNFIVSWWHHAITCTKVDLSPVRSSDKKQVISQHIPQPSLTKCSFKITYLQFYPSILSKYPRCQWINMKMIRICQFYTYWIRGLYTLRG